MDKLLISSITNKTVNRFISKPSHAVLVFGASGVGKLQIAKYISQNVLGLKTQTDLDQYPYFNIVSEDNGLIGIDQIRSLKKLFNLKTTGKHLIRRIVIVDDASLMNNEGQNALLKILEEPPEDSLIILTSQSTKSLNPTILSRVQVIPVIRPSLDEAFKYFKQLSFGEPEIKKAYLFSNGSIGIMHRILNDSEDSEILKHLEEAKLIIKSDKFTKLSIADEWSRDKLALSARLYSLKRVCNAAMIQSIAKNQITSTKKMYENLKLIQKSEIALSKNANTKLVITTLFVSM